MSGNDVLSVARVLVVIDMLALVFLIVRMIRRVKPRPIDRLCLVGAPVLGIVSSLLIASRSWSH